MLVLLNRFVCDCFAGGPSTTALQEAQIDITDEASCYDAYKNIKGATIDNRVVCALSPLGKDACQVSNKDLRYLMLRSCWVVYLITKSFFDILHLTSYLGYNS